MDIQLGYALRRDPRVSNAVQNDCIGYRCSGRRFHRTSSDPVGKRLCSHSPHHRTCGTTLSSTALKRHRHSLCCHVTYALSRASKRRSANPGRTGGGLLRQRIFLRERKQTCWRHGCDTRRRGNRMRQIGLSAYFGAIRNGQRYGEPRIRQPLEEAVTTLQENTRASRVPFEWGSDPEQPPAMRSSVPVRSNQ